MGQSIDHGNGNIDRVCNAALERLQIDGSSWKDIFAKGPVDEKFYNWLNERFERRSPPSEITSIADGYFSAVFTSSIDQIFKDFFSTGHLEKLHPF